MPPDPPPTNSTFLLMPPSAVKRGVAKRAVRPPVLPTRTSLADREQQAIAKANGEVWVGQDRTPWESGCKKEPAPGPPWERASAASSSPSRPRKAVLFLLISLAHAPWSLVVSSAKMRAQSNALPRCPRPP